MIPQTRRQLLLNYFTILLKRNRALRIFRAQLSASSSCHLWQQSPESSSALTLPIVWRVEHGKRGADWKCRLDFSSDR
jgi:hypothetical protein